MSSLSLSLSSRSLSLSLCLSVSLSQCLGHGRQLTIGEGASGPGWGVTERTGERERERNKKLKTRLLKLFDPARKHSDAPPLNDEWQVQRWAHPLKVHSLRLEAATRGRVGKQKQRTYGMEKEVGAPQRPQRAESAPPELARRQRVQPQPQPQQRAQKPSGKGQGAYTQSGTTRLVDKARQSQPKCSTVEDAARAEYCNKAGQRGGSTAGVSIETQRQRQCGEQPKREGKGRPWEQQGGRSGFSPDPQAEVDSERKTPSILREWMQTLDRAEALEYTLVNRCIDVERLKPGL